ncbi:hypothetical protein J2W92_002603 [Rhizobium leguminosarum]
MSTPRVDLAVLHLLSISKSSLEGIAGLMRELSMNLYGRAEIQKLSEQTFDDKRWNLLKKVTISQIVAAGPESILFMAYPVRSGINHI